MIERCGKPARHVVRVVGVGRFVMCPGHLADKQMQHLITIKVANSEMVDGLGKGCDAEIEREKEVELVGKADE